MEYRRFGKTDKNVSVITLGGMRFKHVWDEPRDTIPDDTLEDVSNNVKQAFDNGINLIETAYGYKKSEKAFGIVLNDLLKINRSDYFLMTKNYPDKADTLKKHIEKQLKTLKTDYLDFFALHGINNEETYVKTVEKDGAIKALLDLKNEGVIKHIGFSTHAPLDIILKTIETDAFDFVNLHYYYIFQRNKPAIDLAAKKDMGIFIISPNDKGGQLFKPPTKLIELTKPFNPIQWNTHFCLSNPNIHTLSFGFPETVTFNDMQGIFPLPHEMSGIDKEILKRLDGEKNKIKHHEFNGYEMENDPSGINIPEILRFRLLVKAFNMIEYGKYRYNMFTENDHWFKGAFPTEERLAKIDMSKCPKNIPLKEMIRETHKLLFEENKSKTG